MEPQFVTFESLRALEVAAGVTGRPLFGEGAMLNLITFEPNAVVPSHSHPHEQLGLVISGEMVLVVAGVEHRLGPLDGYALPGGVEHTARSGADGAVVLDVFSPVREDLLDRWTAAAG